MTEKISASLSKTMALDTCTMLASNLLSTPSEALATICSFEAPQAVDALKIHGASLAKTLLPKETTGIIISLCDGVYSPKALAGVASSMNKHNKRKTDSDALKELLESSGCPITCEMYPIDIFSTAFLEHPKLRRVILVHCTRIGISLTHH